MAETAMEGNIKREAIAQGRLWHEIGKAKVAARGAAQGREQNQKGREAIESWSWVRTCVVHNLSRKQRSEMRVT